MAGPRFARIRIEPHRGMDDEADRDVAKHCEFGHMGNGNIGAGPTMRFVGPGRERVQSGADGASSRRELVDQLNAAIARMEGRRPGMDLPRTLDGERGETGGPERRGIVPFGIGVIDAALGGGLAVNALHEVRATTALDLPSAAGFALAIGGLLAGFDTPLFWITERQSRQEAGGFYGPGFEALGFEPARLVRVFTENCAQALWAAGEIAASPGTGICMLELRGNPARADLAFSRRLSLRARTARVPVILLRQYGKEEASAAATRWRVSAAPSRPGIGEGRQWVGPSAWEVALEKCRGGRLGEWKLEWRHDECLFAPCAGADTGASRCAATPRAAGTSLSGDRPAADFDRPGRTDALGRGLAQKRAS